MSQTTDPVSPATPPRSEFASTLPAMLAATVRDHPERNFLARRSAKGGDAVTFRAFADEVQAIAKGLAALGLEHGDRVGLIAENCAEWILVDQACASLGIVDVPRGADTTPVEMQHILRHSGCRAVFAADDAIAQRIVDNRAQYPSVETIATLTKTSSVDGVHGLDDLVALGAERGPSATEWQALADRVNGDDLLTIVYTSGTTAEPKGVMLTHDNMASNIQGVVEVLHIRAGDRFLSLLPAWHVYERIMDYVALGVGGELFYTDRRNLKTDLVKAQPTVFAAVPRVWESIHDGIINKVEKMTGLGRAFMRGTLRVARRVGSGRKRPYDGLVYRILRATVLEKFQQATGGRLRLAVSGGGALPPHVDETLLGLGIPLLNGYGLTETSPVISVRTPADNRCGTIGQPLRHTEVDVRSLDDDRSLPRGSTGVLWARGPGVMRGYYQNSERTRAVLTNDGWFNTGDLGHVEADGTVRITGRAKDTIVLGGGENVEPEPLETTLKTSPLIDQAVVLGQDQKSLGALIVTDPEQLERLVPRSEWAPDGPFLCGDQVQTVVRKELSRLTTAEHGFRPFERIGSFRVLAEPMTPENGLLTATLKVRRHVVAEQFGDAITAMFAR